MYTMSRRGCRRNEVMYSQLPMMHSDLVVGSSDDPNLGGGGSGLDLAGPSDGEGEGGGDGYVVPHSDHHHHHHHHQQQQQQQQHHHHLFNRSLSNRFMLPQTSKMYQLLPATSSHPIGPPPRQRGRKPQNVHPSMAMSSEQQSYVTAKLETGVPMLMSDIFGQSSAMNHLVMQHGQDIVVGQNMEVGDGNGGEEGQGQQPQGDIILVTNSLLKQGLIDGGEVVVGAGSGGPGLHSQNDIVIDQNSVRRGMIVAGLAGSVAGTSSSDGDDYDDNSTLVIDTADIHGGEGIGGPSVGYDCAECGAVMKSRGSLKKHINKYHAPPPEPEIENENRIYSCPACQYQTQRRDKLDKHIGKHLADGVTITGKRRQSKVSNFPQRMRHAAEEYHCPQCPYKCTVEKALRKHQKLHQSGAKQFVVKVSCSICGKDRSTEADLRKHMKKHRDGRDFHCDICGFASIQLKKIIQHRRMHTGEKPHLCPHCTYRSSRRDNLRSHVRRMHKKENMYIDTFNPRAEAPPE